MFLKKFNEYLKIVRPDTSANNIISGNIYVDIHGKMEIVNMTKNYRCEINIERQGWFTKVPHKLHGKVVDETGRIRYEIHGRWTELRKLHLHPGNLGMRTYGRSCRRSFYGRLLYDQDRRPISRERRRRPRVCKVDHC